MFFNVPARRKFLRSEATEYQYILRMLERLALSRFEVGFSLVHNGKTVWMLPPASSQEQRLARVAKLCGEEFAAHVIELRHDAGNLRLSGWLALPTFSRSQSDLQFAFLNGRYVRDKLVAGAARLAYQDVLFNGRFGAYVLYLDLDPAAGRCQRAPAEARGSLSRRARHARVHVPHTGAGARRHASERGILGQRTARLADRQRAPSRHRGPAQARFVLPEAAAAPRRRRCLPRPARRAVARVRRCRRCGGSPMRGVADEHAPLGFAVAQLHGVYILAQTADGLVLVDMHAAHERVMYEGMKGLLAGQTARQQLLVPQIVQVTPAQAEAAEAHAEEFQALGFDLARWAPDQLALRAIPSLLANRDPAGVVRDVLSDLLETGHSRRVEESINHLLGNHGLPRRGAGAAQSERAGDECAAARNGAHRAGGSVQPRPPDLGAAVARGSRPAVHARALMAAASTDAPSQRRCALLLMGPTGAGKSELAIHLASRLPFEIISVDSAQVYRGMDIGTAKPDPQTRRSIAHHLIDIRDPAMSYSAGEFVRDASAGHAGDLAAGPAAAAGRRHHAVFPCA